jgi:hypothetical protein
VPPAPIPLQRLRQKVLLRRGGAAVPDRVKVGEELFLGGGRRFRVIDVVVFDEEDESPFVGLLQAETA